MARGRGLTKEKREAVLVAYSATGIIARAAAAVGVCEKTIRNWRDADPTFAAELVEAARICDQRIGHLARRALEMELEAYVNREPIVEQALTRTGEVRTLHQHRPLNVAAVRTALTKLDPAWVKPPEDKGAQDPLAQALSEVAAAIGTDKAPQPPAHSPGGSRAGALKAVR